MVSIDVSFLFHFSANCATKIETLSSILTVTLILFPNSCRFRGPKLSKTWHFVGENNTAAARDFQEINFFSSIIKKKNPGEWLLVL